MTNSQIAIESENGQTWLVGDLIEGHWRSNEQVRGHYISDACNAAIGSLEATDGGWIRVYLQSCILTEAIIMSDRVLLDFQGAKCHIDQDVSAFLFSDCEDATIENVKIYPYKDPRNILQSQSKPIVLLSACGNHVTKNNLMLNIVIYPVESYIATCAYSECTTQSGDTSTHSWQEHVGIQIVHSGEGIVEFNTFRKLRIDGVRALVAFHALGSYQNTSTARYNTFSDIHSNHCRSMAWFDSNVRIDPLSVNTGNVFEHIKLQGFCRAEYGMAHIQGAGNHFVACMLNDFFKGIFNPCRRVEYDIDSQADETYVMVPEMVSIANCSTSTNVVTPNNYFLDQSCFNRQHDDCIFCTRDADYLKENYDNNPSNDLVPCLPPTGSCPEPGDAQCTTVKQKCMDDEYYPRCVLP